MPSPNTQELLELRRNASIIAAGLFSGCGYKWNWRVHSPSWIAVAAVDVAIIIKEKIEAQFL